MRIFLAIKLSEETKQVFEEQLAPLKYDYADANWTPKENLHITLEYFGDFPQYKPLLPVLEEVAFENQPFDLITLSGGVFIDSKLTLYIDFYKSKAIEDLVKTVRQKLSIDNKFKFIPHVTVGKYRKPSKQQYFLMKKKFERLEFEHVFHVDEMTLFESVMTSHTPVYRELASFKLGV
jgi:2'-5' RNA ligase